MEDIYSVLYTISCKNKWNSLWKKQMEFFMEKTSIIEKRDKRKRGPLGKIKPVIRLVCLSYFLSFIVFLCLFCMYFFSLSCFCLFFFFSLSLCHMHYICFYTSLYCLLDQLMLCTICSMSNKSNNTLIKY